MVDSADSADKKSNRSIGQYYAINRPNPLHWRNYRGMTVKSDQARQYQEQAGWIAKSQGVQPLTGDIAVRIDVYRPAQRGDLDNSIKVLLDSLNGIAYQDDNQIVKIIAQRFNDKRNPRAEITISSCTEQGNPCLI